MHKNPAPYFRNIIETLRLWLLLGGSYDGRALKIIFKPSGTLAFLFNIESRKKNRIGAERMEDEIEATNGTPGENRRRSGRTIRKPDLYSQENNDTIPSGLASAKRKRAHLDKADDLEDADESSDEDSEDDDQDEEPDDEELKEQRQIQRKKRTNQPATKRVRTTNGNSTTLAIRSANNSTSRFTKSQKARSRPSQAHQGGLYADVFGRGNSAEKAASLWITSVQKDSISALRDLVNLVLKCAGCAVQIESQDIEDLDNVPNKLGDVLDEYKQSEISDYPLISKSKQFIGFKEVLVEFFSAIVKALHASSIFYDEPEIYDNIHIWVATMSGAGYRSFRHTATVISLAMTTALCEVAQDIQESMTTTTTQLETEKKKKKVNKGRLSNVESSLKSDEKKLEAVDEQLRDAFDTVYVHRYRDVDEKIRVECVAALGAWIETYRKMFLEGQYLRYLGWVLSDPSSPTRLEVVKQLKRLFTKQRSVAPLRAFTDRFRSRIVEMGTRDADLSVRAEAIELLDKLRDSELLEPDDIDTIGRLIFDSEPRVRKAVARFFVANIEDLYKASIEDLDAQRFEKALPQSNGDEFARPVQAWIKYKCLAQTLLGYDKDGESVDGTDDRHGPIGPEADSRYMLATQSIFPHMSELENWESLAGCLLYDHSSIPSKSNHKDINLTIKGTYKLNPGEETALLDVLYYSVKLHLQAFLESHSERKSRKTRDEIREIQETTANNLTLIIPQLLDKFGSNPQTAAPILRLEQLLDVDLINDLQNGEGSYSALLEDINKQFITHSDRKVLVEASKALRTARAFEQSKEAAEAQVAQLWNDAKETIGKLLKGKNVSARGTLERAVLGELVITMTRMESLASIKDCTEVLEGGMTASTTKKKAKAKAGKEESLLEILMDLVKRGMPDEDTTEAFAELEDRLCSSVCEVLSFYFRWKVVEIKNAVESMENSPLTAQSLIDLKARKDSFIEALMPVIHARLALDPVRISSISSSLDLFTLFATIRHLQPRNRGLQDDIKANLAGLVANIPNDLSNDISVTHDRLEKSLAKKMNKKINTLSKNQKSKDFELDAEEDIEAPPEDSEDEDQEFDEEEEGEDVDTAASGRQARKQAALMTEQQLCELTSKIVLAIIAGVIDSKVKTRLQTNRTKLGKNYGQILAYLDDKKDRKVKRSDQSKVTENKNKLSAPTVLTGDEIEDDELERHQQDDMDPELEDDIEEGDPDVENNIDRAVVADDEIMGD